MLPWPNTRRAKGGSCSSPLATCCHAVVLPMACCAVLCAPPTAPMRAAFDALQLHVGGRYGRGLGLPAAMAAGAEPADTPALFKFNPAAVAQLWDHHGMKPIDRPGLEKVELGMSFWRDREGIAGPAGLFRQAMLVTVANVHATQTTLPMLYENLDAFEVRQLKALCLDVCLLRDQLNILTLDQQTEQWVVENRRMNVHGSPHHPYRVRPEPWQACGARARVRVRVRVHVRA